MREFKYDVIQLINAVRDRPCLWDKTIENYKDRLERRAAWEEVFAIVDEGYNERSSEDKRLNGESILCKWTNMRDTFVKSLKTRLGRPKRKYIYYDYLKFLLKLTGEEFPETTDFTEEPSYMKLEESPKKDSTSSRKRTRRSEYNEKPLKRDYESCQSRDPSQSDGEVDHSVLEESNDPRIMNEDEAFFASLLPSVVKYSEDERLEFRIEVLAVMRKIKEKRKWHTERFVTLDD